MNLEFGIGERDKIEEYKGVFLDSALYTHYLADEDMLDDMLSSALDKKQLVIASVQGEAIGAMEMRLDGFCGMFPYLALLGVKSGWRKMGVGKQMLMFFEETARQLGYSRASLMVSSFNPRARNLYQKMGYKRIGILPNAVKAGIDENIMVKDI